MAATYTLAALVRKRIENVDVSLNDADIDSYINQAEGILDATAGRSFISTFDAGKHQVFREGATLYAAIQAVVFNMEGFTSTQEAVSMIDIMWDEFRFILALLRDKKVIEYIEGL